jgi:DNA-binding NtrC family response regulator
MRENTAEPAAWNGPLQQEGDAADLAGGTPIPTAGDDSSPLLRYVGSSAAASLVREQLRRAAGADASVLIQGASGTGKELVARIVHDLSARSRGPFVAIDCGALAEGVLESELFGHARGAFTNAGADRRGLFEEAGGGTLFLDEIANTCVALQARLLRVLQEREVRRVGCNRARPVDVRIVAASNRDLAAEALAGRFREDLLYRLDVLQVRLPALKDRRDDVLVLARHFLEQIARRTGERRVLTPRAVAALVAHDWPGNVRELCNALERATVHASGGIIDAEHLPDKLAGRMAHPSARPSLSVLLAEYERCMLRERLEANGWNRTRTALELRITRRCLFDKIGKYSLVPGLRRAGASRAVDVPHVSRPTHQCAAAVALGGGEAGT